MTYRQTDSVSPRLLIELTHKTLMFFPRQPYFSLFLFNGFLLFCRFRLLLPHEHSPSFMRLSQQAAGQLNSPLNQERYTRFYASNSVSKSVNLVCSTLSMHVQHPSRRKSCDLETKSPETVPKIHDTFNLLNLTEAATLNSSIPSNTLLQTTTRLSKLLVSTD